MKGFRSISSLIIAVTSSFVSAQTALPAQGLLMNFLVRPELNDGFMLATVASPAVYHPVPQYPWLAVQRVRVVDSPTFAVGTVVEVYLTTTRGYGWEKPPKTGDIVPANGRIPVGGRILLLARRTQKGVLHLGDFNLGAVPSEKLITLDQPTENSVLGEAFYPTAQTRLADNPSPKWRLLGSLAAAIPGTPDDNAREIAEMVGGLPLRQRYSHGQADDRLSRLFADAVAKDTPYHRALIDHALNALHYLGYEGRYRRDVLLAADDPNAFPDGTPEQPMFYEDASISKAAAWPDGYKPAPPLTNEEVLVALRMAKSPTIVAYHLGSLNRPSNADVRSLARFLDSPDARPRWAMVERLCAWFGGNPPPKPTQERQPDGTVRITEPAGLAESVAQWKVRLTSLLGP